jgi:alkyl sulfatase BDS1-like metallo-beta-lactamase superfamily hydrolase
MLRAPETRAIGGGMDGGADRRGDASEATKAVSTAGLDWGDRRDFDEAARGLIAPLPDAGKVLDADGHSIWDLSRFAFIHGGAEAPETVNPSLWRQMQLTVQGGLYEVVPGLYQVRTLDLSNITIAEGEDGLVVLDPLISAVRLNGAAAGDRAVTLVLTLPDAGETRTLVVRNGALSYHDGAAADAHARVTIDRTHLTT